MTGRRFRPIPRSSPHGRLARFDMRTWACRLGGASRHGNGHCQLIAHQAVQADPGLSRLDGQGSMKLLGNTRDEFAGIAAVAHRLGQGLARRNHVVHHRADQGRDALHGLDLGRGKMGEAGELGA